MISSVIIYGVTFIIALVFMYLYDNKYKKLEKNKILKGLCILGIILPPVLLAGLRYGIGIDYESYVINYNYIANNISFNIIFNFYQEPLSMVIYILAKLIFNDSVGFFLLSSFITILFVFLGIKKYKDKINLTVALFIYFMFYYGVSYNAVRQCIAVSIIFFAYQYVIDKKFIKYAIWIIIAGLFHKSAYIFMLVYFLCPRKETKYSKKIDLLYYAIIVLSPIIVPIVVKIIPVITDFLGIYSSYASKEIVVKYGFLLYIIPTLIPIFIFKKNILKENYRYNFFIRVILLQIPLQFAANYIAYVDRIALYSSVVQIVLIPIMIKSIENIKMKKLITTGVIGWYLFYYVVMFIYLNSNVTYPYTSIFFR